MRNSVMFPLVALLTLASCSKKTHPAVTKTNRTQNSTISNTRKNKEPETPAITEVPPAGSNVMSEPAAPLFTTPLIVIDEAGKVITPKDKLPIDLGEKVDYKKITRAFSLEQRKNLIYRFKMVPPRVLFVPDNLASKSARGTYVIYKKKFWYWRKDDGLFHLDETYYQ
ncbi:MAG: hypothetical protein ABIS69_11440 [Sediminibacterium sp.]